jgi:ribulose-phosphate 3-epimerase
MTKTIEIVPSLLAADKARLGEAISAVRRAGAGWVSVDVMDGHFVPNLSFGPDFVRMVKSLGDIRVDAHLMVANPEAAAPWFIEAGADIVTVHLEACADARAALREIRRRGAKAGLAIKPKTPEGPLIELLEELDLALIMTVEPGFGGAKFLDGMLPKVRAVRKAIDARGLDCWLQVDGGIGPKTVSLAASAGADSLVAGSAVFGESDIGAAVRALRERAQASFKR